RLMGKKLLVALTMEGKFAGEGLQNIDEDDDMLSAMARELVEKNGIGEDADSVWKALNLEHQKLFPTSHLGDADLPPAELVATEQPSEAESLIDTAIGAGSVLVFGQRPVEMRGARRRARIEIPEQTSLFN